MHGSLNVLDRGGGRQWGDVPHGEVDWGRGGTEETGAVPAQ